MRNYRTLISLLFALTCGVTACADTDEGLNDSQDSLRRNSADGGSRGSRGSRDDVSDDADEAADEEADQDVRGDSRSSDGGRAKPEGRGRFDRRKHCNRRDDRGDAGRGRGDREDDDQASDEETDDQDERGDEQDDGRSGGGRGPGFGGFLDAGAPRQR